jgi:hypothetical protein
VSCKDTVVIPYEGIRAEALTPGQRSRLRTFTQTSTNHLRPVGQDQGWLEGITPHLSETCFAWMGGFGDHGVFLRRGTAGAAGCVWHGVPCGPS